MMLKSLDNSVRIKDIYSVRNVNFYKSSVQNSKTMNVKLTTRLITVYDDEK